MRSHVRLGGMFVLVSLSFVLANSSWLAGQEVRQLINNDQVQAFSKISFNFRQKSLQGNEPATKEVLDLAARYYVHRVTLLPAHVEPKTMAGILQEFEQFAQAASVEGKTNRDTVAKLAPLLVDRFKEVFDLDFNANRISQVNAAILLPHLARLKHDDIGEFLTALIDDDKKHDAVRVYALKGLREYFPAKAVTKFEKQDKTTLERKARDVRRVQAVLKFIDRDMPPTNVPEEINGFRFIRKEAVATLAEAQAPAVSALGKVEGPVALGLVKILAKKTRPEPTIHERLEAALGICALKSNLVEEYDPRIGVYLVGQLITDVIAEYKKDLINIQLSAKVRKPTYLSWKIQAKRLEAGLEEMRKNLAAPPVSAVSQAAGASAQNLEALARPLLKNIYDAASLDNDQGLRNSVAKMKPQAKALFKSKDGKSMVDFDFEPAEVEP